MALLGGSVAYMQCQEKLIRLGYRPSSSLLIHLHLCLSRSDGVSIYPPRLTADFLADIVRPINRDA
jgi:hypothetical protein